MTAPVRRRPILSCCGSQSRLGWQLVREGRMSTIFNLYRRRAVLLAITGALAAPETALAQNAVVEDCRQTVGRPFVQSCVKSGKGSQEECRTQAAPQVRACVQKAMAAKGLPKNE